MILIILKFPSPLGVIFSLICKRNLLLRVKICLLFPSPLGVIFSLIYMKFTYSLYINYISFRLLSELYSLLLSEFTQSDIDNAPLGFPSPLGVIFSLIIKEIHPLNAIKFPSPLGVIFSLIYSVTDAQPFLVVEFPSPLGVIFSLIVYKSYIADQMDAQGFRLLSELYSLL